MADDDRDEKLADPANDKAERPKKRRRWGWKFGLLGVLAVPAALFALWVAITLNFSYSKGDRTGYLQKFSKKGWLCKTWEGELAMAAMPGAMPEIWRFTVRDDQVAERLRATQGQRVTVTYDEHKGVPTSCFGETQYYATGVRPATSP